MTQTETRPEPDEGEAGLPLDLAFMIDPKFAQNPRPYYERLRQLPPQRYELDMDAGERSPMVLVSRSEDIDGVLRKPLVFSSRFGDSMGGLGNDRPMIPLQIDPPEHKKYRVLLDPYFAPRRMAELEPDISKLVNQLIDVFIDRGSCELVSEFAVPLPCTVFLRLLGLPLEHLDFFLGVKEGIVRANGELDLVRQIEARQAAGRDCYAYFEEALDRLERNPVDGLLCDLLEAEVEGQRLTRDEIMDICYLLIIAGLDTVTDSLCCFFSFLAEHSAHRQQIVGEPGLVPAAVEELLRWESPVSVFIRAAAEDTEISGCPVHKGDSVMLMVGSANTDPSAVEGAGEVDFGRTVNRHRAFGGGIHRCLGSHLARQELRVALREWHRRIPDYHIEPGANLVWTPMLRAVHEMPLVFSA